MRDESHSTSLSEGINYGRAGTIYWQTVFTKKVVRIPGKASIFVTGRSCGRRRPLRSRPKIQSPEGQHISHEKPYCRESPGTTWNC